MGGVRNGRCSVGSMGGVAWAEWKVQRGRNGGCYVGGLKGATLAQWEVPCGQNGRCGVGRMGGAEWAAWAEWMVLRGRRGQNGWCCVGGLGGKGVSNGLSHPLPFTCPLPSTIPPLPSLPRFSSLALSHYYPSLALSPPLSLPCPLPSTFPPLPSPPRYSSLTLSLLLPHAPKLPLQLLPSAYHSSPFSPSPFTITSVSPPFSFSHSSISPAPSLLNPLKTTHPSASAFCLALISFLHIRLSNRFFVPSLLSLPCPFSPAPRASPRVLPSSYHPPPLILTLSIHIHPRFPPSFPSLCLTPPHKPHLILFPRLPLLHSFLPLKPQQVIFCPIPPILILIREIRQRSGPTKFHRRPIVRSGSDSGQVSVPSHTREFFLGNRISATHFLQCRCRTPRYLFLYFLAHLPAAIVDRKGGTVMALVAGLDDASRGAPLLLASPPSGGIRTAAAASLAAIVGVSLSALLSQ
ncbi:unnamed protein product [Closterium sp. Naga37s-1]|nr:unnamed protein product [Closterium sp. Naga37s-1]